MKYRKIRCWGVVGVPANLSLHWTGMPLLFRTRKEAARNGIPARATIIVNMPSRVEVRSNAARRAARKRGKK